jgi:hypothetical protein
MTAAVFQATIHGLRTVPSRGVVQVIVEAKIEELPSIARIAEHGAWVAVARLSMEGGEAPASNNVPADTRPRPSPPSDGAKRTFRELNPAQQAGILCNEEAFWLFLKERENLTIRSSEQCADAIRNFLNIKSRTEIAKDHRTRVLWNQYVTDYRAWMKEAEVIP